MSEWHIITCEFPPIIGGVGHYSHTLSRELANKGEEIHVWCPAIDNAERKREGFFVHAEFGSFSIIDLIRVDQKLNEYGSRRHILLQWVPHGYGWFAMNMFFCLWVLKRAKWDGDQVDLMIHEPYLKFKGSIKQRAASIVQKIMLTILLQAAAKIWIASPNWKQKISPYLMGRKIVPEWLPVFSNIPILDDKTAAIMKRKEYGERKYLMGHFGTYNKILKQKLVYLIPEILKQNNDIDFLLLGKDSDHFRTELVKKNPEFKKRISAPAGLPMDQLSLHISACDFFLQPYPAGINGRHTSALALLEHGKTILTNYGPDTEAFWFNRPAVRLFPGHQETLALNFINILKGQVDRTEIADEAKKFYHRYFDIQNTIHKLTNTA